MWKFLVILCIFNGLSRGGVTQEKTPEVLVGVYYFSGWWEGEGSKYLVSGQDWRDNYPGRMATLGEYNDQKTMDREIVAAADHGVNFFQFLWYFQGNKLTAPNLDKLNAGVSFFTTSPESGRMKFTAEYVNSRPFGIFDEKQWEGACREWCTFMKHARYLRVDGKAVFKIHSVEEFRQQAGGNEKAAARLTKLRAIAKEEGVGELLISGGVMTAALPEAEGVAMYDFLTTYMDVPALHRKQDSYPYSELLEMAQGAWKRFGEKSTKPYVPYVPAGWDPRPWRDARPSFSMPDEREWMGALMEVRKVMDRYPDRLGVPMGKDRLQKMIMIYAWNEFGEGGYIAPTQADGGMKLNVIQKVFGGG
jgi:hypothetical protein